MKISQKKMVQVDVRTMEIYAKIRDMFTYSLKDAQGEEVYSQDDGYVPDFMPGDHYGDYIILTIDIETGVITNWCAPTAAELEKAIDKSDE